MEEAISCIIENQTSWIEIINIVIATINVGAVIIFFIYENNRQKKDKLNNYNLSWYKLINLPDRTNMLNNIVNEEISKLDELTNNSETNLESRKKEAEKLIVDFNNKIINEKNIISPIMKCVSEQGNKEIIIKLNELREIHDNKLISSAILGDKCDYSDFIELKNGIIECYYNIGEKFIK